MDKRVFRKLGPVTETIIEAYINGMTLGEIAKIHNVSLGTIRNLLIANNVPRRKRGKKSKEKILVNQQTMQSDS